jgi:hypothetical protein
MERERRRYCRLTARCLPQWAPLTLVQRFDDGLSLLGMARRERRRAGLAKHSAYEQWCADRIAFTVRLCTYHPDMRGVWATLATTPATGKGRRHWTGEGRIAQVLRSIDIATLRFAKAPKPHPQCGANPCPAPRWLRSGWSRHFRRHLKPPSFSGSRWAVTNGVRMMPQRLPVSLALHPALVRLLSFPTWMARYRPGEPSICFTTADSRLTTHSNHGWLRYWLTALT